jgi:cation:H+ antiporter
VVLIASVTSLPELITGASSVVLFDTPDLAVGNVLGACMFNILTIALLDVLSGPTPISTRAHQGQVLAAGFGVLLLGTVSLSLAARAVLPAVGWIGSYSLIFLLIYMIAIRTVFLFERRRIAELVHERVEASRYDAITLRKAYRSYALNAMLVIGAAAYLPSLGGAYRRSDQFRRHVRQHNIHCVSDDLAGASGVDFGAEDRCGRSGLR